MNNIADFDCIEKVLNGDINSYSLLIEKYQNMIYTLAYRLLNDRHNAEELAQDTFMKAFNNLSQFKRESKFSSWLYTICYRTGLNRIKKTKTGLRSEELQDFHYNINYDGDDSLQLMTKKERHTNVNNSLSILSPEDKYIIQLFYYEEMSIKEIVDIVGLTETNIKSRLFRSRKALYQVLKDKV
jgi:RNA polymerase sigma-70 factor (ECF subfamily)